MTSSMPNANRSVRKVKGGAYCNPTLVARKPDPQTTTKYQASQELEARCGESSHRRHCCRRRIVAYRLDCK